MTRPVLALVAALGLAAAAQAGELDKEAAATRPTAPAAATPVAATELDQESPAEAHRRYGYGYRGFYNPWNGYASVRYRGFYGGGFGGGFGYGYPAYYGGFGYASFYRPAYYPTYAYYGGFGYGYPGYCW